MAKRTAPVPPVDESAPKRSSRTARLTAKAAAIVAAAIRPPRGGKRASRARKRKQIEQRPPVTLRLSSRAPSVYPQAPQGLLSPPASQIPPFSELVRQSIERRSVSDDAEEEEEEEEEEVETRRVLEEVATEVLNIPYINSSPPAPPAPRPVRFTLVWRCEEGKNRIFSETSVVEGVDLLNYSAARLWATSECQTEAEEGEKYALIGDGGTGTAWYKGLPVRDHRQQTCRDDGGLHKLDQQLISWHEAGREDVTIEVVFKLKKVKEAPPTPIPAPNVPPIPIIRRTATSIQRAALPEAIRLEEEAGNRGHEVTSRWLCKTPQCYNKNSDCWIHGGTADNPHNHFPIHNHAMLSWAAAISRGDATADHPSAAVVVMLTRHRNQSKKAKAEVPQSPIPSININNTFPPISTQFSPNRHGAPASSPVTSDSDITDILHQFFVFLHQQPRFKSKEQLLRNVETLLIEKSYNIDGIKEIPESRWEQEWSFPIGLLGLIRRKVHQWKVLRSHGDL